MGPRGGRRHGERKAHKSGGSWPIIFVFVVMALIWVVAMIVILPRELNDIKVAISRHDKVGDGSRIPMAPSLPASWSSPPSVVADFPVLPRRVRPDKNRPRAEIDMDTIVRRMRSFLDELDSKFKNLPNPEPYKIWDLYKAAADKWLLPMDREHEAQTLFEVREDETIFVSVASYRDENCPKTLNEMFSKARRPENVYIGLVQQNCVSGCRTGVLEGGVVKDTEPDINCYEEFCASGIGAPYCEAGNVRNFFVDEAGSLGPAVARYFASKLWKGENFFMQIDAHSLFESDWDTMLVQDIHNTPSYPRSVLSHYPPDTKVNYRNQPGYRICGAEFAKSKVEYDIVRLGAGISQDRQMQAKPCPAPFVGAGFFFAHAEFLADVPFDPYVPWVFMGEEILVSLRMWTWGYDIYSPTRNVLSHFYVRRHTPKFWETVNRLFHKPTIHNDITRMLINRVKNIAGYPESSADILMMPSLLAELDLYGEGDVRTMEDYLDIVGLDMVSKRTKPIEWCTKCQMPYPL